ncbi:uncharacterized protein HRG_08856 [Hirsutella rhossiliensis]|uniref:Uncharacterized protein n=1 Tax=Hirsutella rhossiliensis TaxID=111463 RepID=A0A9P8MRE0_9HYPO|nr:uncharacterized protein HRG_08856 [Hirsutella rhossiliensis]KAH0959835.1 hypothetical protein HRG_08856 [Hirsutella rhossiliensis]
MSSSASGTSANANAPALDINEFLDIAEFNRGLATIFNMDLFNTPVNETSDEIHYNTFVLARIVDYKVSSTCQGLELLGSFQEDFEDWEEDDFKKVDPRVPPVTPDLNLPPAIDREAYRTVPPVQVPNEDLDPAIANQFSKLWDRKLNYSGDAYDILDDKIRYFLDACLTASIKPSQFHALFSNILTKRAKNFFVHQVSRDSTFAEMYQKMKQHFDTEVNRQQYHTDWTSINFTQLRKESPEKPLSIASLQLPSYLIELFATAFTPSRRIDMRGITAFLARSLQPDLFQGILPDTGAAKISTAGIDQFRALQREMPTVQLRKNATIATVRFGGNEPTNTIGITTVITPIGEVVFHVINMSTPFLLCLKDMDRLGAYLNNVTNELICGDKRIPIIKADAPRRFKFTLKDNCDFNYELIVDSLLQMAFKSVNDTAGPDGLVPTLLVFEVTVELDNGPAKFRSTAVQPYFRHPDSQQQRSHDVLQQPHADNQTADNQADSINVETECAALDLAVKLRAEKKITTAGRPFEASDDLEITNLLGAGVIVPERYDMNKHGKHRLFKSRMVREVKGYGDDEKQINVTTAETNADTALQVNAFGVAALQTDDTLLVGTTTFLQREDRELCFQAKPKKTLREGDTCDFNGSLIALEKGYLLVMQKGQVNNLNIIDLSTEDRAQRYVEQRAHPTAEDFQALNKRIQWQIDNPQRGLRFVPIGLEAAKVFVFTDGSFANNKDLSSQIGFVIIIATETNSTKCKRVTRSVLASEIYGLASGFDLAYVITETINQITNRLGLPQIPLVVSYEQRDITSIRWINGADNPADAMTKLSPNGALTRFVNDNEITIRLEGWVQRKEDMTIEEAIND